MRSSWRISALTIAASILPVLADEQSTTLSLMSVLPITLKREKSFTISYTTIYTPVVVPVSIYDSPDAAAVFLGALSTVTVPYTTVLPSETSALKPVGPDETSVVPAPIVKTSTQPSTPVADGVTPLVPSSTTPAVVATSLDPSAAAPAPSSTGPVTSAATTAPPTTISHTTEDPVSDSSLSPSTSATGTDTASSSSSSSTSTSSSPPSPAATTAAPPANQGKASTKSTNLSAICLVAGSLVMSVFLT